jgi:hypothetical protein
VLLDTIGLGAMGTVYHALHEESGARVAVKVVRPDAAADPLALSNLTAEIRAVASLDHPNIIRIFDVGLVSSDEALGSDRLVGGTPWFAMEVADQGALKRRLRGLDGPELLEVFRELLEALAHAHARGILHLDLKPANVLFGSRSTGPILSDFGMGVVGDPDPTGNFVRGTPHFMAPEQVRGRWEELGPWTDLYAFGCLVWYAVTGATPMPEGDPPEILAAQLAREPGPFEPLVEVPEGFEAWVRWLLAKDSDRRPRYAADARRRLTELMGLDPGPGLPADWRNSEDGAASEPAEVTGFGLAVRREPPLVGRTRERTVLWEALRAAAERRPQVVVIGGPRGSGKTRLARWLGIRAHELGAALSLHAGGGANGSALHAALRRAFPVDLRDWDAEAGLSTRLIEHGLSAEEAGPAAAWLAHGRVRPGWTGDPPFEVVCSALRAASADRPVVVLLDDVHTAPDGVRFVRSLLEGHVQLPVVFVLTVDDETAPDLVEDELQGLVKLPGASRLALGPLSEQARHNLARRMLPLDPSLAFEVADRSGGSPGFTVELLHELANKRVLEPSRRGLTLPPGVELAAPSGLVEASTSHLAPLLEANPAWELPMRIAACLGSRVDEALWNAVCRRVGVPLPPELPTALVEAHLWRREGSAWRFLLPAMVESLATGLADPEVHRICAGVLAQGPDRLLAGVEWERAGEPGRALDAWLAAARHVQGAALLPLLTRIRGVAPEVLHAGDPRVLQVAAMAAECSLALGWLREAGDAASKLLAHAAGTDRQRARMLMAAVAVEDQDGRALRELLEDLSAAPLEPDDPWQAGWRVAWAWRHLGDVVRGRPWVTAPGGGEHRLEALRYALLDGEDPASLLQPTRELGAAPGRLLRAAAAHFEGTLQLLAGSPEGASAAFRAARRRYRTLGYESDERVARIGLLLSSFGAGQEDEALRLLEQERQREGTPRVRLSLDAAEVVLRLPKVRDLRFPAACQALDRAVARAGMLDAELALLLEAVCRTEGIREDRADVVRTLVARHRGEVVVSGPN